MVWSYFFFLLWFAYLIFSPILIFTRGFLLTRESLEANATCFMHSEISELSTKALCSFMSEGDNSSCFAKDKLDSIVNNLNYASEFCLPPRARVVLVIIDALRYDFTLYDAENKNPLPFQNRLPIIKETLEASPEKTRLYRFIADPPTTTMQRLKALTTGSLPTFIDAGSNFASTEIKEDNIIDQVVRNNLSVVFMGDDTWESLYPRRFRRSYPFPSFNVRDLDTVDQGVTENLYPELKRKDWNLLIGHYLGVDHAGHRYGPNHREMQRKLEEMNTVIKNVIRNMDDDMVLYVIGDHGMTSTGDHGGETENEVSSALYVYSKLPLAAYQSTKLTKQVNLVPIMATVLGVPIPFSNLGSILHEALPILNHPTIPQWKFMLFSHWSNLEQIVNYLKRYSKESNIFEKERLEVIYENYNTLKAKLNTIEEENSDDFRDVLTKSIEEIREMCEEVWIQFDSFSISRGLLLLFLSLFFIFIIWDGVPRNYLKELFLSPFLLCSYIACLIVAVFISVLYYFGYVDQLICSIFFGTGVTSQFMLAMLIVQNWDTISLTWHAKSVNNEVTSTICRLILVCSLVGMFSNSYIQEEASIILFLLTTISLLSIIVLLLTLREKYSRWTRNKLVLFSIAITILLRSSMHFWRCREEQGSCFNEFTSYTSKDSTKSTWTLALASLAVFVFVTKTWLRNCGSLNGYSFSATLAKYAPSVMVISISGYWVFHKLPFDPKTRLIWKADHLVWFVYVTTFLGIFCTFINPLLVYILPRRSEMTMENDNIIPNLFRRMKGLIEEKEKRRKEIPIIYGLGTVYSSTFIVIGVYLTIAFGLILGEAVAPSAAIMFLTAVFMLILISIIRIEKASNIDDLFEVPNISILVWVFASHYFFYATGHQPAWSNIDWNSAFIGTSGILANNFVQGTLVILNTFCPFIIMGFLLPMITIAPFTLFLMTPSILRRKREFSRETVNQGELILFENSENMFTTVLLASCKYLGCHGIRVFASMLAATVHCRHLMVWKLFAPKFIFESVGMCVTLVSVLAGYVVLVRINSRLEVFLNSLNKNSS